MQIRVLQQFWRTALSAARRDMMGGGVAGEILLLQHLAAIIVCEYLDEILFLPACVSALVLLEQPVLQRFRPPSALFLVTDQQLNLMHLLLEICRLANVEYRWNKALHLALPVHLTGKGRQIINPGIVYRAFRNLRALSHSDHQHPEHLSFSQLIIPFSMFFNKPSQLMRSLYA